MISMPVNSWSSFKSLVTDKDLRPQYKETNNSYDIHAIEGGFVWSITLLKNDGDDVTDFEDNHKDIYNTSVSSLDLDGALVVRQKAAKKGWHYAVTPIEFESARRSTSVYSRTSDGTDRDGVTLKVYDDEDEEITEDGVDYANLAVAVKTVIDFEPEYDYEVIGGFIRSINDISSDIRLWIVAVPDIPEMYGGSKEMVGGLNLNYMKPENVFNVDGRVSKYLTYNATYHTNKLRIILKYPAGTNEKLAVHIEHYKQ